MARYAVDERAIGQRTVSTWGQRAARAISGQLGAYRHELRAALCGRRETGLERVVTAELRLRRRS
jgi:hypothetical protein